jgi:hypothetical protein
MRYVSFVLLALLVSTPGISKTKSHKSGRSPASLQAVGASAHIQHHKKDSDLGRVYEKLIRDTRKQMTPSSTHWIELTAQHQTPTSQGSSWKPSLLSAQDQAHYQLISNSHAAIPWAEGSLAGTFFP